MATMQNLLALLQSEGLLETETSTGEQRDAAGEIANNVYGLTYRREMKGLLRDALREGIERTGFPVQLKESLVERIWKQNDPYIRRLNDDLAGAIRKGEIPNVTAISGWFNQNAYREEMMGRFLAKQGINAGFAFGINAVTPGARFIWLLGTNENHCPDCFARGGEEFSYGDFLGPVGFPGSDGLQCMSNCQCSLVEAIALPSESTYPDEWTATSDSTWEPWMDKLLENRPGWNAPLDYDGWVARIQAVSPKFSISDFDKAMDIRMLNQILEGYETVAAKFPTFVRNLDPLDIQSLPKRTWAQTTTWGNGKVTLNGMHWAKVEYNPATGGTVHRLADFMKSLQQSYNTGWHPSNTPRHVIEHELFHGINGPLVRKGDTITGIVERAWRAGQIGHIPSRHISDYAKRNWWEYASEMAAAYYEGQTIGHRLPKEIWDAIGGVLDDVAKILGEV